MRSVVEFRISWFSCGPFRSTSNEITGAADASAAPAQGNYLVFPVSISMLNVIHLAVVLRGISQHLTVGITDQLNSIDCAQCGQLWSFVFHGFHLLPFVVFVRTFRSTSNEVAGA